MSVNLYLLINHYLEGSEAKENCAIVTDLSKKHMIKSSVIIDILAQLVLKNESGFKDEEQLLDHYFARYKEPIAESVASFLAKAEKYPYFAKQLERISNGKDTSN